MFFKKIMYSKCLYSINRLYTTKGVGFILRIVFNVGLYSGIISQVCLFIVTQA